VNGVKRAHPEWRRPLTSAIDAVTELERRESPVGDVRRFVRRAVDLRGSF